MYAGRAVGVGMRAIGIEHKDGETLPLRWGSGYLPFTFDLTGCLGRLPAVRLFLFSQTGLRSVNQEVVRRVHSIEEYRQSLASTEYITSYVSFFRPRWFLSFDFF